MPSGKSPEGGLPEGEEIPEGFEEILKGKSPEERRKILADYNADKAILDKTFRERPELNRDAIIHFFSKFCDQAIHAWSLAVQVDEMLKEDKQSEELDPMEIEQMEQLSLESQANLRRWQGVKQDIEAGSPDSLLREIDNLIEVNSQSIKYIINRISSMDENVPDEKIAESREELIKDVSRLADFAEYKRMLKLLQEQKIK